MLAAVKEQLTGIEIIPFDPRHVEWIVGDNPDVKRLAGGDLLDLGKSLAESGVGYTAVMNGYPFVSAGMNIIRPNTGIVWAYTGNMKGREIWFVKTTKYFLERTAIQLNIKRAEAVVLKDFMPSRKWLYLLGFRIETPHGMKNYGSNGETFIQMARIF